MSAIVCTACGQRNRLDAPACVRCSAPLASRAANPRGRQSSRQGASFFLTPTIVLAVVLAAVGVGGVQAAGLLSHAMTPSQPSDVASLACSAFQTQNYQQLINAFDANSTTASTANTYTPTALTAKLRAQDATAGPITKCSYKLLGQVPASASQGAVANFGLSIQRAHQNAATTLVLIVDQQPDGTWKISRKSNLAGAS